jgi:signal transduction histidine kinase
LVFSLIRELVTNVSKHADAGNLWIRAERAQDGVAVSVRDDGRGFRGIDRSDAIRTGHIGLASSEERVDALGGEFRLQTAPGLGTDVRIWIPLSTLEQVRLPDVPPATPATPDA